MFILFAAFVSYIYFGYTNNILLDTSVRVCFRVCVHIICIHLLPMGTIKGTDSSCSWVEFPLHLGSFYIRILSIANVLQLAFVSFSLPLAIC